MNEYEIKRAREALRIIEQMNVSVDDLRTIQLASDLVAHRSMLIDVPYDADDVPDVDEATQSAAAAYEANHDENGRDEFLALLGDALTVVEYDDSQRNA